MKRVTEKLFDLIEELLGTEMVLGLAAFAGAIVFAAGVAALLEHFE